ncbi:Xaa-Pro peptidase family protein [Lentilactobacillus sp. Marseille-Q4993]|uniref:M24 family metallopeptidase n=1 Tax=Lentilactobacillus sp. Marseille-Q4993 TaxID=3039492 RepID=UPI0024BCBAFF|nr:Xaa-Pro peptidase family protein [Lentilactobacillus sp. Marseille-Q4993]
MDKIQQIQDWLVKNKQDMALISDPKTIQYLTSFYSDPIERVLMLVVFKDSEPFIFAPALEVQAIKETGFSHPVYGYLDHENPWKMIADQIHSRQVSENAVAIEKTSLVVDRIEKLQSVLPDSHFDLNLTPFIEQMRLIKSNDEIEKLKIAGKWADFAFKQGFEAARQGVAESAVAAKLEFDLKNEGIMEMSFDTLVQAGAHAAEPHGATSTRKIENNQLVLFDLGTVWDGYISDASRTVAIGKPDDKSMDIYKVCLEAQLTAQSAVKPGMTAEELDKIARDVIDKAGYGEYFIHRLGHGMGMSEHEFPSIMEGNKMELQPGMCFSIEPGIYIPEVAGVRIEDCVYVTENGCEPFTHTTKELQYVD